MEDMDVLVSPAARTLVVNPESPNFARAIVKAVASDRALFSKRLLSHRFTT
jgi:hypothetical protein